MQICAKDLNLQRKHGTFFGVSTFLQVHCLLFWDYGGLCHFLFYLMSA